MSPVALPKGIPSSRQSAPLSATSRARSSASLSAANRTSTGPVSLLDKQKGVQGSQFTSIDFIKEAAWCDNVFVERLWRTIKYEEVYLHAYASVREARAALARYLTFYNARRPHSSLDRQTPDQAYFNASQPIPVAA